MIIIMKYNKQKLKRIHHERGNSRIENEEQILQKQSWSIENEKHLGYWLAYVITRMSIRLDGPRLVFATKTLAWRWRGRGEV